MTRLLSTLVILAGVIFAGVMTASRAQAQNYPWCAQYSGNNGGAMNCGFVSFEQCMMTVRGMGRFCIQNNTYKPAVPARPVYQVAGHHARKHS